jgi:hypothetical protein
MTDPIDLAHETAELLRIHAQDRQAHFGLDVDSILEHQGEPFVTVGNGRIDEASRAEVAAHFTRYFAGAAYFEWDDLEPPRIQVSEDATLAWMIVRNRVRRSQALPDGTVSQRQFVYAGLMGYARRAGQWWRIANVSTFTPD